MTARLDPTALRTLLEMVGDDAEFVDELADTFLDDVPPLLERLRVAAASGDADGVIHAAHTLKSTSASFGALDFAALCRELETRARTGAIEDAAERAAVIEAQYPEVVEALGAARAARWAAG